MKDLPAEMDVAVYRKPRVVEIERRAVPEVGPDEVLLQISYCGICGTDLHLMLEGMGRPDSVGGHEYSGRIVALGSSVADFALGETVVGGEPAGCGSCDYCRAGRPSLCTGRSDFGGNEMGAFAEYVAVRADRLVRIPDSVSAREAALTEPLAVALHALTLAGVRAGDRVLVTGAGPLGMLLVAALVARGIDDVTVSEPSLLRREGAERVGARATLPPEGLATPPMPFMLVDSPFDVAFECSGNPAAMEAALAQLRRAGKLVLVGTGMRRPSFDHNRILLNELVVTGAFCYDAGGFRAALALLAEGNMPTDQLIEPQDVPLRGLFDALERLERQELAGKVMIAPGLSR